MSTRLSAILICALFLPGCLTVNFFMPDQRFLSPENLGDLGMGRVGAGIGGKSNVILAETSRPTDEEILDSEEVKSANGLYASGVFSLAPVADLHVHGSGFGAKFQLLGDPETRATPNQYSLAVAAGFEGGDNSSQGAFGSGEGAYDQKTKSRHRGIDLMVITGYRLSQASLAYMNVAATRFSGSGSIVTTRASGTESRLTVPEHRGRQSSFLLGIQHSWAPAYVMIEGGISRTTLDGANPLQRWVLGALAGVAW